MLGALIGICDLKVVVRHRRKLHCFHDEDELRVADANDVATLERMAVAMVSVDCQFSLTTDVENRDLFWLEFNDDGVATNPGIVDNNTI